MSSRTIAMASGLGFAVLSGHVMAATATKNESLDTAGKAVAYALPVFAAGVAVYHGDANGLSELGGETFLTMGTAWALKQFVREKRPDGSDFHSFPSGTTAIAASGSSFLWGRYGWEWGLPAFAASQFVSYTRVETKQHHWYDTIASSAIAISYAAIVTRRYQPRSNFQTSLDATPGGAYLRMSWQF